MIFFEQAATIPHWKHGYGPSILICLTKNNAVKYGVSIYRKASPQLLPLKSFAKIEGVCGREIRSTVVEVAAAMVYESTVKNIPIEPASTQCFQKKMEEIIQRRKAQISEQKEESLSPKTKQFLAENAKNITKDSTEKDENVNS